METKKLTSGGDRPEAWIEGSREKVILQRDDESSVRIANFDRLLGNWSVRMRPTDTDVLLARPVAELFMTEYEGVLQGNFGQSTRYGEPVLWVISERLPVSSYFGILTFVITYLVCIPLGVFKAVSINYARTSHPF